MIIRFCFTERQYRFCAAIAAILISLCIQNASAQRAEARVVGVSGPAEAGGLYSPNRSPLLPTRFMKLPPGSISPGGWLRKQLELDASGIVGQMPQLSDY